MYLYFISDSENIKVGIAKDIRKRIKSLQTGNPYGLTVYRTVKIPEAYAKIIENDVHSYLSQYRLTGEWFDGKCKKLIDKLSDNDICNININGIDDIDDRNIVYLYEINDSEYADFIIKKYKIIFKGDAAIYVGEKRLSKFSLKIEDMLSDLDNEEKYPIYTLDKNKAIEYAKNVAIKKIEYVNSKIKSHYNIIEMLTERVNELKKLAGE